MVLLMVQTKVVCVKSSLSVNHLIQPPVGPVLLSVIRVIFLGIIRYVLMGPCHWNLMGPFRNEWVHFFNFNFVNAYM